MKNPTLLQYFHWYYPDGGKLWSELAERADGLNDIGINMVWLPPACKGASGGYSVAMIATTCLTSANLTKKELSRQSTAINASY